MMNKTKWIAGVSLIASLCLSSESAFAKSSAASTGMKATITWWSWTSNPDKVIAAFNKVYPNIKVVHPTIGSGNAEYTKLTTVLKAGSGAPDVVQIEYQYLPRFISTGGIADISQYDAKYNSMFPKWVWNQVDFGGKLYAVPEDIGPVELYYRPDVFKANHLAVPKTWAQFHSEALKFHKTNPGKYLTFFADNDGGWITNLLWQAGARPFHENSDGSWSIDINSPIAKKVMNYWGALIKAGAVQPASDWTPSWEASIGKGVYASLIGAAWSPAYEFGPYVKKSTSNWNAADMPQWGGKKFVASNWGGSTNAVTTQSKNQAAAALFAAWINTSSTGINLAANTSAKGGRDLFPAATAGTATKAFNAPVSDLNGQIAAPIYKKAAASVDKSFEWSPWTDYVYNELTVELTKAAQGKESFSTALDNVQNAVVQFAKSAGYQVK